MEYRRLGTHGPRVSAIGLGTMGMSDAYGPADRAESIATVHAALDAGINLIDTGDFYGMGHNEMLLAEALASTKRADVLLSVKFGALRDPAGNWAGIDTRPAAVKTFLAYSLKRLRTDYVDIYRPSRLDPDTPIEETVGAIADLVQAGYVRYIGLSELGPETIRRAAAVHPIADLQIEYAVVTRGIEAAILPACRELGIGISAYGVLSRGLISGHWSAARSEAERGFRAHGPRFAGENLSRNLAIAEQLRGFAAEHGASATQLAIAWVLARGDDIVPVIGSRTRAQLAESLGALQVDLTAEQANTIAGDIPQAAGGRYPEAGMRFMDSERG